MKKAIPIAGWLVFAAAVAGASLRAGPDDPLMASFKASGAYGFAVVALAVLSALVLIRIVRAVAATAALHRKLDALHRRKDR